jgi:hypothetical protein
VSVPAQQPREAVDLWRPADQVVGGAHGPNRRAERDRR